MAINRDEIEKYIFDPEHPKQCKSYKLLLRIAKRENYAFFSPDFLQYFVGQSFLDGKFKDELWDVPENYYTLSFSEKIDLYVEQLSQSDLDEFKENIEDSDLPFYNIFKYSFLEKLIELGEYRGYYELLHIDKIKFIDYVKKALFSRDGEFENYNYDSEEYNKHFILFSKEHFGILHNNIQKSSIFITLEESIDKFLENENSNVKPIFLKKIEDVDILLNVLQKDIQQEKYAKTEKEEIVTIDNILVENFFSIDHMKLDKLKDKKEIYIVGENGDGKTLLLQSIAIGLAGVKEGDVFNLIKAQEKLNIELVDSKKTKHTKDESIYEYIFAYGASRYNSCQMKEDETGYLTLFENRYDLRSPVEWLQYLDHNEKSGKENIVSVNEAKTLLNKLLNRDVEIEITPDDVIFKEKGSEVSFEQLSAGYKGVITIICDLIARLYEKQPYIVEVKDFRGVVLIDEVELHLHPKWKYNFMKKLRETFPLIQFIVTTHSPTVILGASKEAVFYKIYKDDGKVTISNQIANEGYTNNSLVSSPLFDMETITSRDYTKVVSSDDYIYEKIHQQVAKKIEENINMDEAEILKLIDKELDKI
ncbi:SMC domain protein [hydrothermal vent metagenome]|uniref:SMC domain protein n=1 Tax=hydrothermal vent metagenome TaxID=652676 RepID=A0A1W1C6J6_9ZZZZ